MAQELKVELQDADGNIYYLHTVSDAVYCMDGDTVESKLSNAVYHSSIVNNCTSTDTNKPLAANQGKVLLDKYNQLNTGLAKKTNTIAVLTVNSGSVTIPANSTKEITKTFTPWGGFDVFCLLYTNINGNTGLSVNSATVDGTSKTCGAWINNHNSSSSTVNIDWGILMVAK